MSKYKEMYLEQKQKADGLERRLNEKPDPIGFSAIRFIQKKGLLNEWLEIESPEGGNDE